MRAYRARQSDRFAIHAGIHHDFNSILGAKKLNDVTFH